MPPLLLEDLVIIDRSGIQNGVEVDVYQVIEIFGVGTRYRVACSVRISESV